VNDILAALEPVVDAFDALLIRYRVGGSVASSALGVPRSTLDVDVVCEMDLKHIDPFVARLVAAYYVDAEMICEAIRRRSSFNLIHLASMLKVDVFVRKNRAFDVQAFERCVRKPLDVSAGARAFDLTTAEDVILHKLEWYRLGGGVSERQWLDLIGVMRVQSDSLDLEYLRRWAREIECTDLLERAVIEAAG